MNNTETDKNIKRNCEQNGKRKKNKLRAESENKKQKNRKHSK